MENSIIMDRKSIWDMINWLLHYPSLFNNLIQKPILFLSEFLFIRYFITIMDPTNKIQIWRLDFWTSTFYGYFLSWLVCLPPFSPFLQMLNCIYNHVLFLLSCDHPISQFCMFGLYFLPCPLLLYSLITIIKILDFSSAIIIPLMDEINF